MAISFHKIEEFVINILLILGKFNIFYLILIIILQSIKSYINKYKITKKCIKYKTL